MKENISLFKVANLMNLATKICVQSLIILKIAKSAVLDSVAKKMYSIYF